MGRERRPNRHCLQARKKKKKVSASESRESATVSLHVCAQSGNARVAGRGQRAQLTDAEIGAQILDRALVAVGAHYGVRTHALQHQS